MNRRTFLKTLVALGASLPLPLDLLATSDRELDAAWQQARGVWDLFEVGPFGVLSFANYENLSRRDAYYLPWAEQLGVEDIERCQPLQWKVCQIYLEELEVRELDEREEPIIYPSSLEQTAKTEWPDWFQGLQGKRRDEVHAELDEWLADEPDWSCEDDYLPHWATGQGAAFQYFEADELGVQEALNIRLIDGDYPGHNYIGAHLEMPIVEANGIAERNGWPIRFVEEGAGTGQNVCWDHDDRLRPHSHARSG